MASEREHLLVAFAEAWPIATEPSFTLSADTLTQTDDGTLDPTTRRLAADLENWMLPRARGAGIDGINLARDLAWFGGHRSDSRAPRRVTMLEHLRAVARRYLIIDGNRAQLRPPNHSTAASPEHGETREELPDFARRWRWISLLLPPDLLIAAALQAEPPTERVSLVPPLLERVLRKPNAETHHHVGAAVEMTSIWASLMRDLSLDELHPATFDKLGSVPFGSGGRLLELLLCAAIVRLFLARHLRAREHFGATIGQIATRLPQDVEVLAARISPAAERETRMKIHELLHCFATGSTPPAEHRRRRSELACIYRRMIGAAPPKPTRCREELFRQDPLARWLAPSAISPETRWMSRALHYLDTQNDPLFSKLLFQYIRVRSRIYGYLTQEPGTSGLGWFVRYSRRIGALRRRIDPIIFDVATDLHASDVALGALEARASVWADWGGLRNMARDMSAQVAARAETLGLEKPEAALLLMFVKEERSDQRPYPAHASPGPPAFCRFGSWYLKREREARAIERMLLANPELLVIFRALDVGGEELSMPLWPTIPLLARCREASRQASRRLAFQRPAWGVPPLRLTYHAGEDYRRLAEGVRRVFELVEFGVLEQGDRLGHGVAIGADPQAWVGRRTLQPIEDRLDDLVFEHDLSTRGVVEPELGRLRIVEGELDRLGRHIYGPEVTLPALVDARRKRHRAPSLAEVGFPKRDPLRPRTQGLLFDYLSSEAVYRRGQQICEVETTLAEARFLERAQVALRRELARLQVTIETNPSSNLLIGDYAAVDDHPIFRLHPRAPAQDGSIPMLVSINTDDPITFATSLGNEVAQIYYALLRGGLGSLDALSWLDRVRELGWSSRFSLARSKDEPTRAIIEGPRRKPR